MSVWRRFQRVGKKAAKFQFTASYTELTIETNNFKPSNIIITCMRRSRKYHSESVKLMEVKPNSSTYSYVWDVPRNEEIVTTLYKVKKDLDYEEKDWTFQLEDVGDDGSYRRLLAFRGLNVSQYAQTSPTQCNVKVSFKVSTKKIKNATLFLTLSGVLLSEGEATDDDMISISSFMSMKSNNIFTPERGSDTQRLSDMANFIDTDRQHKVHDTFDELGNARSQSWNSADLSLSPLQKDSVESDRNSVSSFCPSKTDITTVDDDRLSNITEEDRSPAETKNSTADLLDWSKFITCGYKHVSINNFTTSFRDGIAFCAIIHHFNPDLIDFDALQPSNVKENNRIAFAAAATLGIPKVLDPNEMNIRKVPDSLSVITYLHQLRTQFTDNNLVITPASIGHNSEHNYTKLVTPKSPPSPFDAAEFSRFFPTTLDPVTEDSDSVSNYTQSGQSEDGSLRDGLDCGLLKGRDNKKSRLKLSGLNVDGTIREENSRSDKKMKPLNFDSVSLITGQDSTDNLFNTSSIGTTEERILRISTRKMATLDRIKMEDSYINAETLALEGEQEKIDEEASELERQLRVAVNKDRRHQSTLLAKWFVLVDKKNALIRRNMQLQTLEKEQDLERKCRLLQEELWQINAVEQCNKTEEMKRREDLLVGDLFSLVDQRDKVVNDIEQGNVSDSESPKVQSEKAPESTFPWSTKCAPQPSKNCFVQ